jgi:hypothetical protein
MEAKFESTSIWVIFLEFFPFLFFLFSFFKQPGGCRPRTPAKARAILISDLHFVHELRHARERDRRRRWRGFLILCTLPDAVTLWRRPFLSIARGEKLLTFCVRSRPVFLRAAAIFGERGRHH